MVELRNSDNSLLLSSLHCCRQRPKRGERIASSAFACWWEGCQASGWSRKEYHCRRYHLISQTTFVCTSGWPSNLVWTAIFNVLSLRTEFWLIGNISIYIGNGVTEHFRSRLEWFSCGALLMSIQRKWWYARVGSKGTDGTALTCFYSIVVLD